MRRKRRKGGRGEMKKRRKRGWLEDRRGEMRKERRRKVGRKEHKERREERQSQDIHAPS